MRRNPDNASVVISASDDAKNAGSVRFVTRIYVAHDARQGEYRRKILVGERPALFQVDERDRFPGPVDLSPCPSRVDPAGGGIEVQLLIGERVISRIDGRVKHTELLIHVLYVGGPGQPLQQCRVIVSLSRVEPPVQGEARQLTDPAVARDLLDFKKSRGRDAAHKWFGCAVRVVLQHARQLERASLSSKNTKILPPLEQGKESCRADAENNEPVVLFRHAELVNETLAPTPDPASNGIANATRIRRWGRWHWGRFWSR